MKEETGYRDLRLKETHINHKEIKTGREKRNERRKLQRKNKKL